MVHAAAISPELAPCPSLARELLSSDVYDGLQNSAEEMHSERKAYGTDRRHPWAVAYTRRRQQGIRGISKSTATMEFLRKRN